jgi:hypothetical protein
MIKYVGENDSPWKFLQLHADLVCIEEKGEGSRTGKESFRLC